MKSSFCRPIEADQEGFLQCLRREGTPRRVHFIELYLDPEIQAALSDRFSLLEGLDPAAADYEVQRQLRLQTFLGYDYVRCGLDGLEMPSPMLSVEDTAQLQHSAGRKFEDEHRGCITDWDEFEAYVWPDPDKCTTESLEWYDKHLPENMCVIGSSGYASGIGFARFFKTLSSLMGYETLCYALFEDRDLVNAIVRKLTGIYEAVLRRMLEFPRVKVILANDDMGFRSGPLISPADLRELILPAHKLMADITHAAGRLYVLHSCGNLKLIMEDLIEDVRIDAKHSYEDIILEVTEAKKLYGDRIAVLGGIDMDFMARRSPEEIRARVRRTLDQCMPGGGYCLGTGNTVANYIPVENYLAMLDEGRAYC